MGKTAATKATVAMALSVGKTGPAEGLCNTKHSIDRCPNDNILQRLTS